jgi:hypothetical protein
LLLAEANMFFDEKQICASCGSTVYFLSRSTYVLFTEANLSSTRSKSVLLVEAHIVPFSKKHSCASRGSTYFAFSISTTMLLAEVNLCLREKQVCASGSNAGINTIPSPFRCNTDPQWIPTCITLFYHPCSPPLFI